jgi:monoamine oxidase
MDRLPRRLAAGLRKSVSYFAHVTAIHQTSSEVIVRFRQGGRLRQSKADRVICALPLPALSRIEITPALSWVKRHALNDVGFTSVLRIFLQFRQRFWERDNLSGLALTDLPIMRCMPATPEQHGAHGILETFSTGRSARLLGALGKKERLAVALRHVETCFPGAKRHFEIGESKYWDEDRWAGGGYCFFRPGQFMRCREALAAPEGRLHFASDHTSLRPAWVEGSIESGLRAAAEVNSA